MSMKGISSSAEPDKISKRMSSHKRNDAYSDELDVFEAAVYFSGYNDDFSSGDHRHTQKYGYNAAREDQNRRRWGILGGGRRRSLDLPMRCSDQVHHLYQDHQQEVTIMKERFGNVRHKQPSSPGGRIASFLNSLFHQPGSKKNKSKEKTKTTNQEDEEEIHGGGWMRRRRRSSISHFLSSIKSNSTATTTSSSSKYLFSSSSSGFRTPPPYLNTPTKNYKQFLNFTSATNQVEVLEEKKINKELSWLDEKLKVMENLSEKEKFWADHDDDDDDDRRIKREGMDDDGMESDSSSDLFELQNYELSRGGLPVYETTNVANINNSTHL